MPQDLQNTNEIHKNEDSIIKSTGNNNTEHEMKEAKQNNINSFIDSKGQVREIPQEVAQKWLDTFQLKDLQESYTPKFSKEVKEALEPILQGQEISLSVGSLIKLIERDRLEFLPLIKDTLEHSDALVMQNDGALIFVKDYRHESLGKFFASVSKDNEGQWVITSNAPKNLNNLHNKIKEGGKVLFSDLPELPIIAKPELPTKALNGEANLKADSTTKT